MTKVMWQPPAHQSLYAPDHPTHHGCDVCTVTHEPRVVRRRPTRRWAQRVAERLNNWSLTPGWFYVEGQATPPVEDDGSPSEGSDVRVG